MKFVNFQKFALLMQNFINLCFDTNVMRYRNDKKTKFPCRRWIPYIFNYGKNLIKGINFHKE